MLGDNNRTCGGLMWQWTLCIDRVEILDFFCLCLSIMNPTESELIIGQCVSVKTKTPAPYVGLEPPTLRSTYCVTYIDHMLYCLVEIFAFLTCY